MKEVSFKYPDLADDTGTVIAISPRRLQLFCSEFRKQTKSLPGLFYQRKSCTIVQCVHLTMTQLYSFPLIM